MDLFETVPPNMRKALAGALMEIASSASKVGSAPWKVNRAPDSAAYERMGGRETVNGCTRHRR